MRKQLSFYLFSIAFSGIGLAMQQLLLSWLLVGILLLPADKVGIIQASIALPGILLMLWGGAKADQIDPRRILLNGYLLAWILPICLIAIIEFGLLNLWSVACFGLLMSVITSVVTPAQQSLLNQIARQDIQRGVTAVTGIGFVVQIIGFGLAGQLEIIGTNNVLLIQAAALLLTSIAVAGLKPTAQLKTKENDRQMISDITLGFKAVVQNKTIFNTLLITFISGIFNAGAFLTAIPFIVKRVYEGSALGFATVMVIFYSGAAISNLIQYKLMPLAKPGFWFLVLQLSRILVLFLVWIEPDWTFLLAVLFAWGLNMGVTTNLSRTIVQEASETVFLARILSVYNIGLMGSIPVGAIIIGYVIEQYGTMSAMIPGMFLSALVFLYGILFTGLRSYRSPKLR